MLGGMRRGLRILECVCVEGVSCMRLVRCQAYKLVALVVKASSRNARDEKCGLI